MAFPYPPKPWVDGQTIVYPASGGYQIVGTYNIEKNLWEFVRQLPEVIRFDQVILSDIPPEDPDDGQLWFDTSFGELRLYIWADDINAWLPTTPLAGVGTGDTKIKFSLNYPPDGQNPDGYDLWVKEDTGELYYWRTDQGGDWHMPITRSKTNLIDLVNTPNPKNLPDLTPSDYQTQEDANILFIRSINQLDDDKPDMEISPTAPTDPTNGEFWFDEDFDTLYIWATDHWVTVAVGDRGEVQFLPIVGGSMKGHIDLVGDAVENSHPVTFNQFNAEVNSLKAEVDDLKVQKGADRQFDCRSLFGGGVGPGTISFNNANPTSCTRIGYGVADKFGQISTVPNVGDIIEILAPRGESSRYTYVSGSTDSMTVTFVSTTDSGFVLDDVYTVFVYPQNKAGASEDYVDNAVADRVAIAGDTMTGTLTVDTAGLGINVGGKAKIYGDGTIEQPYNLVNNNGGDLINRTNLVEAQANTLQDAKDYTDQKTSNISVDTSDFVKKSATGQQDLAGPIKGTYFYGNSSSQSNGFITRSTIESMIENASGGGDSFDPGDTVAADRSSYASAGGFYESNGQLYYKRR